MSSGDDEAETAGAEPAGAGASGASECVEVTNGAGNDLAAPVPPGEPPQPPSSAEPSGAAVQSILLSLKASSRRVSGLLAMRLHVASWPLSVGS
eukprot:jgi/Chrpa1/20032/Chrysochromulina_OHIO_Genome00022625-RA